MYKFELDESEIKKFEKWKKKMKKKMTLFQPQVKDGQLCLHQQDWERLLVQKIM